MEREKGRERDREREREKSAVREVERRGTVTEERPHHIQASPRGSYRCSPRADFHVNQTVANVSLGSSLGC